jgi:hypothetical protein
MSANIIIDIPASLATIPAAISSALPSPDAVRASFDAGLTFVGHFIMYGPLVLVGLAVVLAVGSIPLILIWAVWKALIFALGPLGFPVDQDVFFTMGRGVRFLRRRYTARPASGSSP